MKIKFDPPRKYDALSIQEIIPKDLLRFKRFVCYDCEKRPINPFTGNFASSTNPESWGTIEDVLKAEYMFLNVVGIGIVLGNTPSGNLCGIDIDKCINEQGIIAPEALEIIKFIDSYTEYSPSKKGFHILFYAKKKGNKCKNTKLKWCKCLEMYDGNHFFTITGDKYDVEK